MIEIKNLSFSYKKGAPLALDSINLSLKPGEKVLIAGRNGAGKTTLSKIIAGLMPQVQKGHVSGTYLFDGMDMLRMERSRTAPLAAVLLQDFESQLTCATVREELVFYPLNLGVPYERAKKAAENLALKFGIEGLLDRDPMSLSGGEKQKAALLSLLIANPGLLVLDEPFTDIDPASQRFLLDFLDSGTFRGCLVVMEQSLSYYRSFDRIVLMDDGRFIKEGGRETAGEFEALRQAGIKPPDLVSACGGFISGGFSEADLIREAKYFDPQEHEKLSANYANPSPLMYEVSGLQYQYPESREYALTGVSLSINEGDYLVVLGANGSGKTTLMKVLAGIYGHKKGTVLFRGRNISAEMMRGRAGYVYQNPDNQIFAETVFDEIAFALRMKRLPENIVVKKTEAIMDVFGITQKRGLDPFSLPKGDRQLVACASVLVMEPEVIILDEPTTGLDAAALETMMKVIDGLNRSGKTVIIITHYMDVAARYGRRIAAMSGGRVAYCGPKREFFGNDALLKESGAMRTDIMELSLKLNGRLLLTAEEFAACWKDK
ncbi:MAG TPA: ABC transporter ATP-binding protein [Candidatus Goldiibacteriota bacterium]|nr:ABC transporter ATP-binding protein [Candidatus Goldiibacteriota bacterium]